MSFSHTPGPWNAGKAAGPAGCQDRLIYADSEHAFDLAIVRNGGNDDETEANANLIAAAPELLQALRDSLESARLAAIHQKPDSAELCPWYARGLGVIAKAEGSADR